MRMEVPKRAQTLEYQNLYNKKAIKANDLTQYLSIKTTLYKIPLTIHIHALIYDSCEPLSI